MLRKRQPYRFFHDNRQVVPCYRRSDVRKRYPASRTPATGIRPVASISDSPTLSQSESDDQYNPRVRTCRNYSGRDWREFQSNTTKSQQKWLLVIPESLCQSWIPTTLTSVVSWTYCRKNISVKLTCWWYYWLFRDVCCDVSLVVSAFGWLVVGSL